MQKEAVSSITASVPALAALSVVFGDIGTDLLYPIKRYSPVTTPGCDAW
jgi:K+ transporter